MKEKFAKLIDVKSIVTLLLTLIFCILAVTGVICGEQFLTIFTMVMGFYFGTQSEKKKTETAKSESTAKVTTTTVEVTDPPDKVE
ncbi:MAG: hypothetical protein ACI3YH_03865 [Eubacteriales bacterium]